MSAAPGDQALANAVVWPVIAGNCAVLLFTGVLLTVFVNFMGTSGWARSSKLLKSTLFVVLLLALTSAGLAAHDLLFFSTILSSDLAVYELGTAPQAFEPLVAGTIATICQTVLILRASSIIQSVYIRWAYLCILLGGALMGLMGAIGLSAMSYLYHVGDYDAEVANLSLANFILFWLWASAATDVTISLSYIWLLRRKLRGGNDVTVSVVRMIGRIILQSASYTAVMACIAAVLTSALSQYDPATYLINYAFWEPLSILYPLSLFSTLGIADRVVSKLSDFPSSLQVPSTSGSLLQPRAVPAAAEKVSFVPLESPSKAVLAGRRSSYMGVTISVEEERIEENLQDLDVELGRSRSRLSHTTSGAFDEFPRLD